MITPDSSVVIAALAPWHVAHSRAREALQDVDVRLVAHVALETISVLSRMPEGRRIAADIVLQAILTRFPSPWMALEAERVRPALQRAVAHGLRGGALYDALIAATAAEHEARLVSADRRARDVYDALGVWVTYLPD